MAGGEAALLAAIAADPDDDAKRLVYADLLAERGEPRGELIEVQCRQAASGNTPALQARARELEREHGAAWREAAGIRDALTVFHRGFPFTLIGSSGALLASREALRTQPIVSLSVMGGFERLGELVALPEVARIRELTIAPVLGSQGRRLPVPAEHLAPLAATPHLQRVTSLTFEPGALDGAGAQVLAGARWLPGVEKLVLAHNPVGSEAFASVAARLEAATWLWLEGVELRGAGLAAIASSRLRRLAMLGVPDTRLDGADAVALARSPVLATVTRLDLDRNYVGDAAAQALATSPHVGQLRSLNLESSALGPEAARALAASTALSALQVLTLHGNHLGLDGVAALAAGAGLPALAKLGLTRNGLGSGRYQDVEDVGRYELELTAAELAPRFAHRPGLVVV